MRGKLLRAAASVLALLIISGLLAGCGKQDAPEEVRVPVETSRISVMVGSTNEIYAQEHYPDADVQRFNNYVDSSAALAAGKLDYAMMDYANALRYVRSNPNLEIASDFLTDEKLCLGVNKNNPTLYQQVSDEVDRLLADGTVEEIIEHWIRPDGSDYQVPESRILKDAPIVTVAIVSSREPTTFLLNGDYAGLDIELINRVLHNLGYQPHYLDMEWSAVSAAIESGKADMTLGMYNTPERAEHIFFTAPYFTNPMVLLAQKIGGDAAEDHMANAAYGVMTGSTAEHFLAQEYPNASIHTYTSIADAFMALDNNKIDFVLTAYTTALNALHSNPAFTIYQKDIILENVAIAITKENAELRNQLDALLTQFKADGTLDRIIENWTSDGDYVVEEIPVSDGRNGVLRVAIAADREPMCFVKDNQYRGLDCELIERMAYELGMKVEYQNMAFSSLIAALHSAKADVIISNMTPTPERAESVDFTQPYFDNPQVLVARKDVVGEELEYTSLSQLKGKTLATLSGSVSEALMQENIEDIEVLHFNLTTDELAALKGRKVEGVPLDEPVANLVVSQNPDFGILPELLSADRYGIALVKDSPLTADFNRLIADMIQDGTLADMRERWIGADASKKRLPENGSGENGTLKVACTVTLEPMCYIDGSGQPTGHDIDLILRIAQALGKRAEFITVDFNGLISMLQSGKADVAVGAMSITDERKQQVDMTDTYYESGVYMVVRKTASTLATATKTSVWKSLKASFTRTFVTEERWKLVLDGLWVTVLLAICSGLLGTLLGFAICMLRRVLRVPVAIFVRLIQGTPIVVLLMIFYYIIFGKVDVSAILVAILGFSINFGVYVSEMMRTGIDAVDKGQIEAANALGFTKMQTFWKITFPQAARHFLPVFKGEFISMVKMTSVVGYIAIQDLTKVSDIIRSRTLEAFFPLIAIAAIYFLVANLLTMLLTRLEINLDPKRRKRSVKGVVVK